MEIETAHERVSVTDEGMLVKRVLCLGRCPAGGDVDDEYLVLADSSQFDLMAVAQTREELIRARYMQVFCLPQSGYCVEFREDAHHFRADGLTAEIAAGLVSSYFRKDQHWKQAIRWIDVTAEFYTPARPPRKLSIKVRPAGVLRGSRHEEEIEIFANLLSTAEATSGLPLSSISVIVRIYTGAKLLVRGDVVEIHRDELDKVLTNIRELESRLIRHSNK